jgi:glycosyltransferase involved in cell wall biosynthesis
MTLVNAFLKLSIPTALYLHDVEFEHLGGSFSTHPLLLCIANSNFTSSRFMQSFGIRPAVLPPCVNHESYRTATNRSKVVFIGLVPQKGVERAFQLAEKRPDIPFEFIESWPLNQIDYLSLQRRAEPLGNVIVRRRVTDMRLVYSMAKIVLVPSVWEEAWGRVCTEAQCSGIPVLASNRGGLPEAVGPGGILVDNHAPLDEWLAALSIMWDNLDAYLRLSEAALAHSRRKEIQFDFLVDELLNLLTGHVSAVGAQHDPLSSTRTAVSQQLIESALGGSSPTHGDSSEFKIGVASRSRI